MLRLKDTKRKKSFSDRTEEERLYLLGDNQVIKEI